MESSPVPQTERDPSGISCDPREEWSEIRGIGGRAEDKEEQEQEEKEAQGSAEEEEEQEKTGSGGRASVEEESGGGGGYACGICGFHAGDVRGLSQHLHTVHPVSSLAALSVCEEQPMSQDGGSLSMVTDSDPGSGTRSELEEAGPKEGGAGPDSDSPVLSQGCPPRLPPLPPGHSDSEGSSEGGAGSGHNRAAVVCLPLVAEGLKLVWTRSDQTQELDGVPELVQAFNAFPYPTAAEAGALARGCGLPLDAVRVWFMVQRVRYGISWAGEEIEETRRKLAAIQGLRPPLPKQEEEGDQEEVEEEEMRTYSPKFWGSGDGQRGMGGVTGGGVRDFLFRRTRPLYLSRGRRPLALRRGLDPAPSPLFVVAPPGLGGQGRGRKSRLQLRALRRSFLRDNWLSEAELRRLQAETGLSRGEVRKWFSDSRYQLRSNGQRPPQGAGQEHAAGGGAEDGLLDSSVEEDMVVSVESPRTPPADSAGVWAERGGEKAKVLKQEDSPLDPTSCLASSSPSPVLLTSRGRLRKTKEQLAVLKQFFLRCQWPTSEDYTQLVQQTRLPRPDVIQWFGDARYRVKNGNLRWVRSKREHDQIMAEIAHGDRRRNMENGGGATDVPAPPPAGARGVAEPAAAEKAKSAAGGTDIRPLELFWRQTGAEPGEADLSTLCRKSGMSAQQVRDWFTFQESGMAEVEVNISD
ncbi:homeobox and leucine zipper encoding b isoform X1 [Anguilla anguilla]|uniref:homeobox and leucine zipper encoding b isoform X1 n=2 Tax=Anguilla anguilla TaxID=7936 RepID=UPI0015A92EB3|nr:homeobox and leucine zipper encoding b isoform X1 [Anguilla anguilla]